MKLKRLLLLALALCFALPATLACAAAPDASLLREESAAVEASKPAPIEAAGSSAFLSCQEPATGEFTGVAAVYETERSTDLLHQYRVLFTIIVLLFIITIVVLLMLISIRRRSARRLAATNEQMRAAVIEAQRASAAKGNFMSRMSHEIRTPLNAIIGYNSIARSDMAGVHTEQELREANARVMDCLTKSDIASRHLLTIINDILDMSAIESGNIRVSNERFDFKNLISSLTVLFYSQAEGKKVKLEVVFDNLTEEWYVGDQMRTNQILTNLLSNAVKFTPAGGSVRLSISLVSSTQDAARIRFEISDTGIGMAKDYLEHIWTPFEQADGTISRRFGGTGLGLSITKNLVDIMGGDILVSSEQGVGSTFTVELDLGRTQQPSRDMEYDFASINALVVDDDRATRDYLKLLFARFGVACTTAASGEDAVEAVRRERETKPFTVCLVDWRMPEMDGMETIKRLREVADPDMPVVIVTAYDYSEIERDAREIGVNRFISKPLFQSTVFDLLVNISGRSVSEKPVFDGKPTIDFGGARVLLAEDNRMNMEVAVKILSASGLTVEQAWDGKQAVAMFESAPAGTYKAILMDVQMPEMDGYEATRTIRRSDHPEAATIPIIAMTADAFAENIADAKRAGMNSHIAKPINIEMLYDTLKEYID